MVGVQVRLVGAAGGAAVAVLAVQQGAVLLVGDQALAASDVEYVGFAVQDDGADPPGAQQPFDQCAGQPGPVRDPPESKAETVRRDQPSTGSPPSGNSTLLPGAPTRVPEPAASSTAATRGREGTPGSLASAARDPGVLP